MSTKLFGTDGIRAQAGQFPLNSDAVFAIGKAISEKLGGRILIGRDTRISSPWIFEFLCRGAREAAAEIEDAGVIPTPAIALLTKEHSYAGGVMISASHNPYEDNGIKLFGADGTKLKDDDEADIERRVFEDVSPEAQQRIDTIPNNRISAENRSGWPERYQDILASRFPEGRWLNGMHVVVDCANGAMTAVAPELLRRLGAEITVIHGSPNGRNINADCGAVHLESLIAFMKSHSADFGVAFDGDGDRSLFVSGGGRIVDGDSVLLLMARSLKRAGVLSPLVVIGTLMTNFSLERMLREEGITLTRVSVGDRFIFEEMQRSGAVLGGEPSGHIIFSDFRLSGDGLFTTLKVAAATISDRASLDNLTRDWVRAPQLLKNLRVREKIPLEEVPAIARKLVETEQKLRGHGRLVVRYSGTEPVLRIMVESDDAAINEELIEDLMDTIKKHIS